MEEGRVHAGFRSWPPAQFRTRKLPLIGAGDGITSFIHVDDAASAAVAALDGPPGIYNIADDEPARAAEWMPVFAASVGATSASSRASLPGAARPRKGADHMAHHHTLRVERAGKAGAWLAAALCELALRVG